MEQKLADAVTTLLQALQRPPDAKEEPWLSPERAAEYAGVSRRTLDEWIGQGMSHGKRGKVVRIKPSDIDAWLRDHAIKAKTDQAPVVARAADILNSVKKGR